MSLTGFSVHGILQERIPEWVATPFSRVSSQSRDWTLVSHIAGRFFTTWATREAPIGKRKQRPKAKYVYKRISYIYTMGKTFSFLVPWAVSFHLRNWCRHQRVFPESCPQSRFQVILKTELIMKMSADINATEKNLPTGPKEWKNVAQSFFFNWKNNSDYSINNVWITVNKDSNLNSQIRVMI